MAAIKASTANCSKLQLADDDLLIVNVSMQNFHKPMIVADKINGCVFQHTRCIVVQYM